MKRVDRNDDDSDTKPSFFRLSNILIGLILVVGLGLLLYQPFVNQYWSPKQLDKAYNNDLGDDDLADNLARLQEENKEFDEAIGSCPSCINHFDYDDVETLDMMDFDPQINRDNVIAGVFVPEVGINIPIMYGTSQEVLRSAVGTVRPDQELGKGNYGLLGHNSRNKSVLFAPIGRISKGDKIYATDKKKVYQYETVENIVVDPTEGQYMDNISSDRTPIIRLISCTDDSSQRIVVTAELVQSFDYVESQQYIKDAFDGL